MDELFNKAVQVVLKHEGGYCDDLHDPGGATKFGISSKFLKENNLHLNIKLLSEDEAKFIYKKYFWLPYHFDKLIQPDIAIKIFDTAINIGPSPAIKIGQQIVSRFFIDFLIDGIMGIDTQDAFNSVNESFFLDNYRDLQVKYYKSLIAKNPSLDVFLKGWEIRAES